MHALFKLTYSKKFLIRPLPLHYISKIIILSEFMSISSSTIGGGRTKYKLILLGDQSVGKSSIIEKYIKDKF